MEFGELLNENPKNLSERELCILSVERLKWVQLGVDDLKADCKEIKARHETAMGRLETILSSHQHEIDNNSGRISKLCDRWKIMAGILGMVVLLVASCMGVLFTCAPN